MDTEISDIRKHTIEKILHKQDDLSRWGFDEKKVAERPEYVYYSPNFKSTLWSLILLADIRAPVNTPQIRPSIQLISEHFFDPESGIFRLPDNIRFPSLYY